MILKGIKNYFINLKHVFTPLGTLALGFIIGLSVLIPAAVSAVSGLADRIIEVTGNVNINFSVLTDCVAESVSALNWDEPWSAICTMIGGDWLSVTLNSCINSLLAEGEVYAVQIAEAVNVCLGQISAAYRALVAFTVLGLFCGYLLTKYLVRKNMAKRAWWKYFVTSFADSVLTSGLVVAVMWLQTLWRGSAWVIGVAVMILSGFIALYEAYIVHGMKKTDIKAIVNVKNVGYLILTNVIIFAITLILVVIAFVATNLLVGLFISLPLVEICLIVTGLNAEAYVKDIAEKKPEQIPEDNSLKAA